MNTNPNTQETIEKLKSATPSIVERMLHGKVIDEAIELIELLQKELEESQRQQSAAVEDLAYAACCETCKHSGIHGYPDEVVFKCQHFSVNSSCGKYEWRGPQETGKGETDGLRAQSH